MDIDFEYMGNEEFINKAKEFLELLPVYYMSKPLKKAIIYELSKRVKKYSVPPRYELECSICGPNPRDCQHNQSTCGIRYDKKLKKYLEKD